MKGTRSATSTPDRRSARRPALLLLLVLLALGFASATAAQDHTTSHATESLGRAHFPVSCSPAAQAEFDRAFAMLHSFWFPQATVAFTGVTRTDPDCAMAHWGIAMSQRGNPLVGAPAPAAIKAGWAAVEKAKALGARTPRERDYVAAMESYYKDADTVDHAARVLAYEAAMAQVHARHPADPEAATFYALAMNEAILVLPPDKTYTRHQAAARLLETVLAGQPDHPGALHYLIHSYDFPALAARGLPAARRYEAVASSAPHALHMPSHIFSMLGMWEESIRSNRAALGVAKTYVHAVDFTVYAHLQQAQDEAARALVDETAALLRTQAPAGGPDADGRNPGGAHGLRRRSRALCPRARSLEGGRGPARAPQHARGGCGDPLRPRDGRCPERERGRRAAGHRAPGLPAGDTDPGQAGVLGRAGGDPASGRDGLGGPRGGPAHRGAPVDAGGGGPGGREREARRHGEPALANARAAGRAPAGGQAACPGAPGVRRRSRPPATGSAGCTARPGRPSSRATGRRPASTTASS